MSAKIDAIRQIARRLLADGAVDMVIGFQRGTLPMMNEPCFIRKAEEADRLVWDSHCGINLANYVTDRKERVAVVAKGCDSRNLVNHIIENKIKREKLVVIGVCCDGMLDKRVIAEKSREEAGAEVDAVEETGDQVTVKAGALIWQAPREELLQDNCKRCRHRNPVLYDERVGEPVSEKTADDYEDVKRIEAMSPDEKWAHFEDMLSACIRCYACRNACPLCYCPTCFVDESRPQWVGKSQDPIDIRTFHFLRAYHCAGRCTDCGSCERACPMGIPVRQFTRKLNKDCEELYGWQAGLSIDQRPTLDTYSPNDPNDFIR